MVTAYTALQQPFRIPSPSAGCSCYQAHTGARTRAFAFPFLAGIRRAARGPTALTAAHLTSKGCFTAPCECFFADAHPSHCRVKFRVCLEERCCFRAVKIRSNPVQRRSPATRGTQANAASRNPRSQGSEPGSPSPCQHSGTSPGEQGDDIAAFGPPAPSFRLAVALHAGPCCALAGHTLRPFVQASFTGAWAHSSTVWEYFFFFLKKNIKHENCFTVKFIQCNLSVKRTELPPCSPPKANGIFNFTGKGAKEPHGKARA